MRSCSLFPGGSSYFLNLDYIIWIMTGLLTKTIPWTIFSLLRCLKRTTNTSHFIKTLQATVKLLANNPSNHACWIWVQVLGQSGEAWPISLEAWAQTEGFIYSFWIWGLTCIHYQKWLHRALPITLTHNSFSCYAYPHIRILFSFFSQSLICSFIFQLFIK